MMVTEQVSMLSAFEGLRTSPLADGGSSHAKLCYSEARAALEALAIPTRRTEAWKYTPVSGITRNEWKPASYPPVIDPEMVDLPKFDAHMIWCIDGKVMIEASDLPEGVTLCSMLEAQETELSLFEAVYGKQADHNKEVFIAANTAFASDGVFLHLAKNVQLDKPIHLVHVYTQEDTAVMTRNLVIAEEGSQGHMIHSFIHEEGMMHSNSVTELKIGDNARFTLDKLQSGTDSSYHYASEEVHQGRDALFTLNTITLDGAWTRNDPHVRLRGENSICYLNGAYLPTGKELVDNHSIIDHLVPHCESHELYKGVIYEQGKGVFNGKVFVRPDAQKTNAYQQNANIVMSDKASMNSKPELEIYADDVKCSHGSTTGQLDMDALFYLQCRGLSYDVAKQMLVNAFVGEVIERLVIDEVRDWVTNRFSK